MYEDISNTIKIKLAKIYKKELFEKYDEFKLTEYKLKYKKLANTTNISPLRYPGGKTRACKIIDNIMLQYFDIKCFDTVVSPFFGGGSFEFYFQKKSPIQKIFTTPLCTARPKKILRGTSPTGCF
jgi:hypothetical protein